MGQADIGPDTLQQGRDGNDQIHMTTSSADDQNSPRGEPVAATSMSRKYELQMILQIIKTHSASQRVMEDRTIQN